MSAFARYFRIWLAGCRYSVVRTMMFRFDFIMWSLVEFFWMAVNLLLVAVIYRHTDSIAGWGQYEMLLLVGTSMLIQRLLMGFFWTNLFELGRNIRSGHFDFFLAQPGLPLVMVSTRKIDLDGLANAVVAVGVIVFAVLKLGLQPTALDLVLYGAMLVCGLLIHYSLMLITVSLSFWIVGTQGLEGSYFTLTEFSRLPREALRGAANVVFVWALPVVILSNAPANALLHGFDWRLALWLFAAAVGWLAVAVTVFSAGLRRYSSASS